MIWEPTGADVRLLDVSRWGRQMLCRYHCKYDDGLPSLSWCDLSAQTWTRRNAVCPLRTHERVVPPSGKKTHFGCKSLSGQLAQPRRRPRHAPTEEPFAVHKRTGTFTFCIHFSRPLIAACPTHLLTGYMPTACKDTRLHGSASLPRSYQRISSFCRAVHCPCEEGLLLCTLCVLCPAKERLRSLPFSAARLLANLNAGTHQAVFHLTMDHHPHVKTAVHIVVSTLLFSAYRQCLSRLKLFHLWRWFIDIVPQQVLFVQSDAHKPK